jgi:glycerol-3-phosphate O-acyltransferase
VQPPIFQFNRHRDDIERETVVRSLASLETFGSVEPPRSWQLVLNDAAHHEIRRLEHSPAGDRAPLDAWHRLARRLTRMNPDELRDEVHTRCVQIVRDVQGHFDRRVYDVATRVLPVGLGVLFKGSDLIAGEGAEALRDLSKRIRIEGEVETIRRLAQRGTLVVVPTHSSNMDSIVLGWALMEADLPPVTYGAGKNLFSNPVIAFFMRNLGAYRVDRRLKYSLYKEVLKTYSQVLLERGYHSLFFPGGTRSRSGTVERKLKLGLLGSALSATSERLRRGDDRPIFVVPVTINYPLVLEAEGLVEDWLKEAGQAQYLAEDDDFSTIGKLVMYASRVLRLDTSVSIRFGRPMDVFGNPVDADGASRGPEGTHLRRERYLYRDGRPTDDPGRDEEYTRMLGRAVGDAFLRETVILPTQLVGWLCLERERRLAPGLDLFALLRTTSGDVHPATALHEDGDWVRAALVRMESAGRLRLDPGVRHKPMNEVVDEAMRSFECYHLRPALERRGDGIVVSDPKLLFFYGNRLEPWAEELRRALAAGRA